VGGLAREGYTLGALNFAVAPRSFLASLRVLCAGAIVGSCQLLVAAEAVPTPVDEVLAQNRRLQEQLNVQQKIIEELQAQVTAVAKNNQRLAVELGGTYVDFERLGAGRGWESALNARVGRLNSPLGEEYLVRDAVTNPSISHSLADTVCGGITMRISPSSAGWAGIRGAGCT